MPAPRKERPILDGDHDLMSDDELVRHYRKGCGHDLCRHAANEYRKQLMATKGGKDAPKPTPRPAPAIAAKGAVRRLQGLFHLGYDPISLGRHLDMPPAKVWELVTLPTERIPVTTHQAVVKLFQALRYTPVLADVAPDSPAARGARTAMLLADEHHWAGPNDWDDIDTSEKPHHRSPHDFSINWATRSDGPQIRTLDRKPIPFGVTLPDDESDPMTTLTAPTDTDTDTDKSSGALEIDSETTQSTTGAVLVDDLPEGWQQDPNRDTTLTRVQELEAEVSMLNLAHEVRAEIHAENAARTQTLAETLAAQLQHTEQLHQQIAALKLELLGARHEITDLTALAFHLAAENEQAPPAEAIWNIPIEIPDYPGDRLELEHYEFHPFSFDDLVADARKTTLLGRIRTAFTRKVTA